MFSGSLLPFFRFSSAENDRYSDKAGKIKIFLKKPLTTDARCDILFGQQGKDPWGLCAGVAELADAWDLKSHDTKVSYRFEPGVRHFLC